MAVHRRTEKIGCHMREPVFRRVEATSRVYDRQFTGESRGGAMKAVCPLHGPTTIIRTNVYGFPVYACCCDDVRYVSPGRMYKGSDNADLTRSSNRNNRRQKRNETDDRPAAKVLIRRAIIRQQARTRVDPQGTVGVLNSGHSEHRCTSLQIIISAAPLQYATNDRRYHARRCRPEL